MIASTDPLDHMRPATGACTGAVFLSYTFDATFFENEVLATVLGMTDADPVENPSGFLAIGQRRLQETPVVVMIDRGHFRGGKTLPYDLLLHRSGRTFHPKLYLGLFNDHARLVVGSGNLTEGGYGGNAELGICLSLRYDNDKPMLLALTRYLTAIGVRGESWERITKQLKLLSPGYEDTEPSPDFLAAPNPVTLLDQFVALIPPDAKAHEIGVLAPFHQEDGAPPDQSVLDRLLDAFEGRRIRNLRLDVGVSWEGNPLAPPSEPETSFWDGQGKLWGLREGRPGDETVSWFVLGKHVGHEYVCNSGASTKKRSTVSLKRAIKDGRAWRVGSVISAGPAKLVERAAKRSRLRLFLHPEVYRVKGRVFRYPLHAKLILVATTEGGKKVTHLLLGSPNASRMALLSADGNAECALHLRLEGHHHLTKLCPRLVPCPLEAVALHDRSFPKLEEGPERWVEDVCYDAATQTLSVTWRSGVPELVIAYPVEDPPLQVFEGRPGDTTDITDFQLRPGCSELIVLIDGREGRVPIRIMNIVDLPGGSFSDELSFEDLVALHAGKLSIEGLHARREATSRASDDMPEGNGWDASFGPKDVFRAIFSLAQQLSRQDMSLGAFQYALEGEASVQAMGECLLAAHDAGRLGRGETWLYGMELMRTMRELRFPDEPIELEKKAQLATVLGELNTKLNKLKPKAAGNKVLLRFYRGGT